MLMEILSAVNVRKTDQTSVSPAVRKLSQGGNDLSENLLSSLKLVLGFFYLVPGVFDVPVLRFYYSDQKSYLNVSTLKYSFTTGCALTSM